MLRCARDDAGTVLVEYVVVLTLVVVGALGAIVALGPMLLGLYQYQHGLLLLPFP